MNRIISIPVSLPRLALSAAVLCLVVAPNAAAAPDELSDQAVSDKISDELLIDPGVVATRIDVKTNNGIVTLHGQVSNLLAKERSLRIAEAVKGVRSVINRVEVNPATERSDAQIQRDIESALASDPATESYEIEPVVNNGEATLSGTVDSYQERELALKVAKGVRGVTGINDRIEIDYTLDRPDAEIKREIEQALRWNTRVDHFLINVSVNDGKVALAGTVGSAAEKRLAESDAWVAGVTSVDTSKLSVERWARDEELRQDKFVVKSADELRDAVDDALAYDPRVASFNVDVTVDGAVATLRGDVDNLKAKRAAEQDARNTVGISYVRNYLKVRTSAPIADAEIAEEIRNAFMRDPYVERFDTTVTVIDGTAYLYGTVDSYFEKNRADDLASRLSGVLDVENRIDVDYERAYTYDPYVDDEYYDGDNGLDPDYAQRAPLKTDSEIESEIESELWWSPFVDETEISVSVDDGIATLTGTVDSWNEQMAATENAYEGGATLVDNEIVIESN